jgi:putative addiction module component (TIGR02574 family)
MVKKLTDLLIDERIELVEDLWDSIASDQNALPVVYDSRTQREAGGDCQSRLSFM